MEEWVSVKKELPERNEMVYAKDDFGHVFEARYLGRVIGWVDVKKMELAHVSHWTRCRM